MKITTFGALVEAGRTHADAALLRGSGASIPSTSTPSTTPRFRLTCPMRAGPFGTVTSTLRSARTRARTGIFGPVDGGHAAILTREIKPVVLGRDPLASERIWTSSSTEPSRARRLLHDGDERARLRALGLKGNGAPGMPAYRLLGAGPPRHRCPPTRACSVSPWSPTAWPPAPWRYRASATPPRSGFPIGPGTAPRARARTWRWHRAAREAVGEDYTLMFDAFNSWDVPYAVDMRRRIAEYRPALAGGACLHRAHRGAEDDPRALRHPDLDR